MTKITAEEIIDLMFLPITDTRVVETLDTLGIEQPSLDEEYEMEGRIWTEGEEENGIAISFKAPDTYSDDAEPLVNQIDFYNENKIFLPLNLHKSDSYATVIEKIGRKPDFCTKPPMQWSKKWVYLFNGKEIGVGVNFKEDMKSINNIVVQKFNREDVEKSPFLFPCKELEE